MRDIKDLTADDILSALKLKRGELDLLAGCPPCQGFPSHRTRNRASSIQDDRNELIFEFLRFVEFTLPKTHALLKLVQNIKPEDMDCSYVRQPKSLGLGHAVLCAERIVGNEPFAVLLADDLMINKPPADQVGGTHLSILAQMVKLYEQLGTSILAVQEVPLEMVSRYGIVAGENVEERLSRVTKIIEKPKPENAPSNLAVAGRYILTPEIFNQIRQQTTDVHGEIQLTEGIANLLKTQHVLLSVFWQKIRLW